MTRTQRNVDCSNLMACFYQQLQQGLKYFSLLVNLSQKNPNSRRDASSTFFTLLRPHIGSLLIPHTPSHFSKALNSASFQLLGLQTQWWKQTAPGSLTKSKTSSLPNKGLSEDESAMLLHQRLRLDIPPEVSKFLGARTGDKQTDKSLKTLGDWTLAVLQPLTCLILHSVFFLQTQHCSSQPRGGLCVHTIPSSHLTSGAAQGWAQALRAVLSPLPCPQPEMCWHTQGAQGHSFLSSAATQLRGKISPSPWMSSIQIISTNNTDGVVNF